MQTVGNFIKLVSQEIVFLISPRANCGNCKCLAGIYTGFVHCCPNGYVGMGEPGRVLTTWWGCNGRDFNPIRGTAVKFGDIIKVIAPDLYEKYFILDEMV